MVADIAARPAAASWKTLVRAVGVPEAEVDVAAAAGPGVVGLGHEGDRVAVLVGDLLAAVLEQGVAVGGFQRVGVVDVDLVLPGSRFALGELDRDAGRGEVVGGTGGRAAPLWWPGGVGSPRCTSRTASVPGNPWRGPPRRSP